MTEAARISLLKGDLGAIAAIRAETREAYRADDIADDAPVLIWNGLFVRGDAGREYEVPDDVQARYLKPQPFPKPPIARMPGAEGPPEGVAATPGPVGGVPDRTEHDERLHLGGAPVEGDPEAIAFIRNVARLYHELPGVIFPVEGDLRWFSSGLHVVDDDKKTAFQVPMDRVADMIVPRPYPLLPNIRMTNSARKALK